MKLYSQKPAGKRASVLIITLVLTGILGFTLASVLTLVGSQNRAVVRSQTWNATIPIIEAGIEEALAHLNENGLTNLFTQGWRNYDGKAVKRGRLGDGRYTVAITNSTRPIIECIGYLPAPIAFSSFNQGFFAQLGTSYGSATNITRCVRVAVGGGALFAKGMVAKGSINMNGNNVATDSFDSADPNFSVNGRYNAGKRKDNGDVATNSGQANIFDAGNANLMGKVGTGPGGNVTVGANGVIGSLAWINGGNHGIQPGYFSDDMNMSFPEITVPFSGGWTPSGGTISETNYSYGTGSVTVASLPNPLPAGTITTNYGPITTDDYPSAVAHGVVTTSLVQKTSLLFPIAAMGAVTTNTMVVTTDTLPNPIGTNVTHIVTNSTTVTTVSLPSPLPTGTIITNAVATRLLYLNEPMPDGPPAAPPVWTPPEPGTYVGAVTNDYRATGKNADRGWYHDYASIVSFTYTTKAYTITYGQSFTYNNYQYTYTVPQSYTFTTVTVTSATIATETYDYILDSRDYVTANLSGKIYVRGNARINVTGSINLTGQDVIKVGASGKLELYMSGPNAKIAGNGVINRSGNAANFAYYGLKPNTALDFQGNGGFVGVIYAPNAAFKLGGGGNNTEDFVGASVTDTVFMNGHFNFHYDEDLGRRGPRSRYTITSWNEVGRDETRLISGVNWDSEDDPTP